METKAQGEIRSFATLIGHHSDGELNNDATNEMAELLQALRKQAIIEGKAKGSITVTIAFEVDRRGVVSTAAEVKTKDPRPAKSGSVFWLTDGGALSVKNPKQQELPLRDVSANEKVAREVDGKKDAKSI